MAKFDLGSYLSTLKVPDSGTGAPEQIAQIPLEQLRGDERNFYAVDGVEALAANIQLCGLMDPLRVRPDGDGYVIVSGHRRFVAMQLLAQEDARWATAPCIINTTDESPAMQELRLLYANSDTRRMSPADIGKQAQRVQMLLYELKEQGVEFPGRMRDHVAEACKVSKSKLSRLAAIEAHLAPDIREAYWAGKDTDLSEATAYELSRLPNDIQQQIIDAHTGTGEPARWLSSNAVKHISAELDRLKALTCRGKEPCQNVKRKTAHIIKTLVRSPYTSPYCSRNCCGSCGALSSCRDVCPDQRDAQKQLRDKRRAEAQKDEEQRAARERPDVERISSVWRRFGQLREQAGLSDEEYLQLVGIPHFSEKTEMANREAGSLDGLTPESCLPYGYRCGLPDVRRWCAAADALGCSVDYLMMRTDTSTAQPLPGQQLVLAGWMPGGTTPGHDCECVAMVNIGDGGKPIKTSLYWMNGIWHYGSQPRSPVVHDEVLAWMEIPEWPGMGGDGNG